MLYPAELQALPQPRRVTLAQRFVPCLAAFRSVVCLFLGQESIRQEHFLTLRLFFQSVAIERLGLLGCQPIFFDANGGREPNERDKGLDFASATGDACLLSRDSHGTAREWAKLVEAAEAIFS